MTNSEPSNEDLEMQLLVAGAQEAADSEQTITEATIMEAGADASIAEILEDHSLTDDEREYLRFLAELERNRANQAMSRAMAAASFLDWQLDQLSQES